MGYSPCHRERVKHDLATKQQQQQQPHFTESKTMLWRV